MCLDGDARSSVLQNGDHHTVCLGGDACSIVSFRMVLSSTRYIL